MNGYLRNAQDSLDVAQDVFLRAYLALPHFRGEYSCFAWRFTIAINTARSHLQARTRPATVADIEAAGDVEPREARDEDSPERLLVRESELLSYQESSGREDCLIGAVRSRVFCPRSDCRGTTPFRHLAGAGAVGLR